MSDDRPDTHDAAAADAAGDAPEAAGDAPDAAVDGVEDGAEDGVAPLAEVLPEKPAEAREPLRSPWALGGTVVAGGVMGVAEVVPGFSGGTVALVVGIYERLVANVRQGARTLSLLLRARPRDAWRTFAAIEWPFVLLLGLGMAVAVFSLAGPLQQLLEDHVVETQAVFLGLVLGAAVVAGRQLRAATPWHVLLGVVAAAATFVALGVSPGTVEDPAGVLLLLGASIAVCAWILPGVSGSFLLVVLGLYPAVIGALADRDVPAIMLIATGLVAGLAMFSTLLNWLLARAHDVVLAILIGLMVGSVRVLWPWPADAGFGSTELGAPQGTRALLALALALAAFALVWMFGLASAAVQLRVARRRERVAVGGDDGRAGAGGAGQ